MATSFIPGRMYRMPTHFGPMFGPRQGPDGRRYACQDSPNNTAISLSYLSDPTQLEKLLPSCFQLGAEPLVTITCKHMTNIQWLAGRGYAVLGVSFPAIFRGDRDHVEGSFLSILWENMCDPIITGREELGFSKLYCELPDPEISDTSASCTASWDGFQFLKLSLSDLQEATPSTPPAPPSAGAQRGILHYKYMPRTGEWGTADIAYPVLTPESGSHTRVTRSLRGTPSVEWTRGRWEDLPTLCNIVDHLAELEILDFRSGSLTYSVGSKDFSDQRILR